MSYSSFLNGLQLVNDANLSTFTKVELENKRHTIHSYFGLDLVNPLILASSLK